MNRCDNLKPFGTLSPERQKVISAKGGKASGAARKARRERIEAEKIRAIAAKELHDYRFYELRDEIRELKKIYIAMNKTER